MTEQDFKLEPESELRFEVEGKKNEAEIRLVSGKAEVFGMEMAPNKPYIFPTGSKAAIFTWHGCTLRLKGETEGTYIAKETPMVMYVNVHACLEKLRVQSEDDLSEEEFPKGPITMVVGAKDCGKSTICTLLLNYAVRCGRRPIYVDLDVGQGNIAVPGTIGSVLVERPSSVEEGFSMEAPLCFHYGSATPGNNMTLYQILISKMATCVHEKMASNRSIGASGVIINTCGWVKNQGYKSLQHIAQAFEVDVILVLDQERLYNELTRDIPFIKIVFLPKSGGVIDRSKEARAAARDERIRRYFYGVKTKFHPHVFDVKYSQIDLYKIGTPALPDSCMPADMKVDDHKTKIVPVEPGPRLKHSLLSLSMAKEPEEILTNNVAGFVCILDVDDEAKTLSVLSPVPKPLPKGIYILSEVLFIDSA